MDTYTKIKRIHVEGAGTLSQQLSMVETGKMEVLILSGNLNQEDFDDVLDDLCTFWPSHIDEDDNHYFDWNEAPPLRVLDMGECNVVDVDFLPYFGFHMQLDKIVLPKNILYTGGDCDYALEDTFLREIILPPKLKGMVGVHSCERLEHIELPESVEELDRWCLAGCPCLKEFHIPKNVKYIGGDLLAGDTLIEAITVAEDNEHFTSVDGVVYSKDLKTLVAYPCGRKATTYKVPEGTETLGTGAFSECCLEYVELPDTLTAIKDACFCSCKELRRIHLPDSVSELGFRCFGYCTNLQSVHLSGSLSKIESQMFTHCDNLKTIDIPASVKTMDISAFAWNEGVEEIILHDGFESIVTDHGCETAYMLRHDAKLKKMVFPRTVNHLLSGMLGNCTEMKNFEIAEDNPHYKTINGAIYSKDGKRLLSVPDWTRETFEIAEGTEIISEACFWRYRNLHSIHIPDSVRKIESRAFDSCDSLETICLPAAVEEIAWRAFDSCGKLRRIILNADVPPRIVNCIRESGNIAEKPDQVTVEVPAQAVPSYKADSKWGMFRIVASNSSL